MYTYVGFRSSCTSTLVLGCITWAADSLTTPILCPAPSLFHLTVTLSWSLRDTGKQDTKWCDWLHLLLWKHKDTTYMHVISYSGLFPRCFIFTWLQSLAPLSLLPPLPHSSLLAPLYPLSSLPLLLPSYLTTITSFTGIPYYYTLLSSPSAPLYPLPHSSLLAPLPLSPDYHH